MEIRSVHINFDNQTVEVNGKAYTVLCDEYVPNDGNWKRVKKARDIDTIQVTKKSVHVIQRVEKKGISHKEVFAITTKGAHQ